MSDKIREAQAMHLLNEISEAPNEVAIYACLDRIDVFLGKKKGALEWPVADLAQHPTPPAAEQPYSTTSDKIRAELYDERPDTVNVPRDSLERAVAALRSRMCTECGDEACCMPAMRNSARELRALLGKEGA